MKRISILIVVLYTMLICKISFAAGLFFDVNAYGNPANVNITLCLNAKGQLSCQQYNVSALNLSILATVPNHTYPFAGIKINSPFYSIANSGSSCTPLSNGFCMFSVSHNTPANINIKAPDYIVVGV